MIRTAKQFRRLVVAVRQSERHGETGWRAATVAMRRMGVARSVAANRVAYAAWCVAGGGYASSKDAAAVVHYGW